MTTSNIDLIREWIEQNPSPDFPPTIENSMIERFLYVCEGDIKRTKDVLQLFFKFRKSIPEIFTNRDPLTKNQINIFNTVDVRCVFPLPKKTDEGYQVYISHLLDSNVDKFDFLEYSKMFFNITDVRMKTEEKIPKGDIPIFDMTGFSLKHLMKLMFSLNLVKKYMRITQEAHPVYLKQIHVINTSPLLEKVLTMLRPLMREEVKKMIHFHTEGSNTIFEYISPDIIPVDFGGRGTPISDIKAHWWKQIENNREWLLTNPWRNNSDLKSGKNLVNTNVEEGYEVFSSLNLD
ncbi:hypothetical protein PGB90_006554 [Kerria lacca]